MTPKTWSWRAAVAAHNGTTRRQFVHAGATLMATGLAGCAMPRLSSLSGSAADLICVNGKIITVDPEFSVQQAMAIRTGHVLEVGTDADIRKMANDQTRVIDLDGRSVVPGLADNHDHLYAVERINRGIDLTELKSIQQIVSVLRKAVSEAAPGGAVFGPLPWDCPISRSDIEPLSDHVPILLFRNRRGATLLNGAAMTLLGVSARHPEFMGTAFPRSDAGDLTGETPDWPYGLHAVDAIIPLSAVEQEAMILRGQRERHALGLTSIRDLSNLAPWVDAYRSVEAAGKLTLRVQLGESLESPTIAAIDAVARERFATERLMLDTIGENPSSYVPTAIFTGFAREANRVGMRPAPHVPLATNMVIDAYRAADREASIASRRWFVEHFTHPSTEQLHSLAALGVILSVQAKGDAESAEKWMNKAPGTSWPVRDAVEAGLTLISGSDIVGGGYPEGPEANNPFHRIHYYVTRRWRGGIDDPRQAVDRREALRFATINSAYAAFDEHRRGSLEPGKVADFVILSGDYLACADDELLELRADATFVAGAEVHRRPNAKGLS